MSLNELLTRGVANIIPNREQLEQALKSGKKLNIYFGIDPTASQIHLGHAVPLRKLQTLADLGHNITFLIGDFTARIGDPSDKESERPKLSPEQINNNFKTYQRQAEKFLDFSKITLRHNSEWLSKLTFADVIELCYYFSAGDFYSRELIKKRLSSGKHVGLHEVLYSVMQGYDSYHLDTDLQIGAPDQTFNMQAGRTLQKDLRNKQSFILVTDYLEGTDGKKMSKTWNNAIWLEDPPDDIFGKVMSLKDDLVIQYFTLATNLPSLQIQKISPLLSSKSPQYNPMSAKKRLAWQITSELHNAKTADLAKSHFQQVVQKHQIPAKIPVIKIPNESCNLVDFLVKYNLSTSKSAARRLINQGGLKINQKTVTDWQSEVSLKSGDVVQVGKRRFIKIQV